jgi:hypothetical protein
MAEMQRLTKAFVEDPDSILQQLVKGAVDLCEADSAGISIEKEDKTDESFYHWIAISGDYSGFLNAVLPRFPAQHRNEAFAAPARKSPDTKKHCQNIPGRSAHCIDLDRVLCVWSAIRK